MNKPIIHTFKTRRKNAGVLFLTLFILTFIHSPSNAATMVVDSGFESGNISGYSCSGNCPTVATSPVANGKYSGNFDLTRSMKTPYRTESVFAKYNNLYFGQEYWFRFNYRYTNWAYDTSGEMAPFQVHERTQDWSASCGYTAAYTAAPFFMFSSADKVSLVRFGGKTVWSMTIPKNQWINIALHFKLSGGSDGYIELWKDGVKVATYKGPNAHIKDRCGRPMKPPYIKMGTYKWDWKAGRPATKSTRRQFFLDNVKLAAGSDGYSLVTSTASTKLAPSTFTTSPATTEDLIARWPMNTGTSTTTPDASGNGYTGTLVNGARITSSGTLLLDGVNDYVNVGKPNVTGKAMTISAWFWSDDLANCFANSCRIISKAVGTAEQANDFMISTAAVGSQTRLRFRLNTNGATSTLTASSGNLSESTWIHVAAVYDGNTMRLYKDGELVGSRAKTGNITLRNTGSTWIGGNGPSATSRPWKGMIDDVSIYNYALTASEIAELAR